MKHKVVSSPFVWEPDCQETPPLQGPLAGLRLAVKDLFALKGSPTTAGNPNWPHASVNAQHTASAISQLTQAGAVVVGKTITDEIAYSLNGQNIHYGTPCNPITPDRFPGGSSSGSAVAVSGNLADIGLGTDTGGSIRVPASYNGLFGLRPTHGVTQTDGLVPLAPSFDTVGWMTRSLDTLERVAQVALPTSVPRNNTLPKVALATNLLVGCEHEQLILAFAKQLAQNVVSINLSVERYQLSDTFRILQGHEIWQQHGKWITQSNPHFAPDISSRLAWCALISKEQVKDALKQRNSWRDYINSCLQTYPVMMLPTTPGCAPFLNTEASHLVTYRNQLLSQTAMAGLAGLPQLHLPLFTIAGAPCGLSLIGAPHSEFLLFTMARQLLEKQQ